MKYLRWMVAASLLFVVASGFAIAQPPERKRPSQGDREGKLKPGDVAPTFQVKDMSGKKTVSLSSLKGKPVVLFFGSCT